MLRNLLLVCLGCLLPGFAHAAAIGPRPGGLCESAIARAEQRYGTPPGLLLTIGKVESGRPAGPAGVQPWPWTINADGQGLFFDSKDAAIAWARDALLHGVRFLDMGCMQIDLQSHPRAFASLEQAFDPEANADYGARFLKSLHDGPAGGNWFLAIGMYHSQTPDLAADYRLAVTAVGAGLSPFAYARPGTMRLGRVHFALAGGGAVALNLYRQPARVHRRLTACQINAVLGSYLRSPARCAPKG